VFRVDSKAFRSRSGMVFDGSITTDGTSVSVYLKHPDAPRRSTRKSKATLEAEVKRTYIENNLPALQMATNVVVIDPNKRDLLYCQDSNHQIGLRYTANQRAKESGARLYRRRREELKRANGIDQLESTIPTHKTMDEQSFCVYLSVRAALSLHRQPFYDLPIHNKYKWKTFINTQRSESRLIRKMHETYGNDFTVVLGDWSDAGRTAKFQTSSKTKGWRTVFQRNRIPCYLIDEFRTSSRCPLCHGAVEKNFKRRPSSRPWQRVQGKSEYVHGLLGCNNRQCIQQRWTRRYWNRDRLSTCNMLQIVESMLLGGGRPLVFSRGTIPVV
jgi:hypothetical protein